MVLFNVFFDINEGILKNISALITKKSFQVYLLHYAFSMAYIFTYPAAQAGCPSFIILSIIKFSMPRGLTKKEICSFCLDKKIFSLSTAALVNEDLVKDNEGYLAVTKKGHLLLKVFIFLRKIFGLPPGQG